MTDSEPFASLNWHGRGKIQAEPAPLRLSSIVSRTNSATSSPSDNRLIEGDNLAVMQALLNELKGQIDLIYVDPPFLTGKAYSARVGAGEDSRRPSEWETVRGYSDDWTSGAEYLSMLYARLKLMYQLLAETGTMYLHLDWHASAYARVMMDEIFGPDRLLNEIIWVYHGPSPIRSAFNRKHDTILAYSKSDEYTFNVDDVRIPYADSTVKTFNSSHKAGFGKKPDLKRGKVPEDWWYFPVVARLHSERTGYPTQKPEALLERIILASSNPGDLVADFFCGAGTTLAVAQRQQRHWLGCDHTSLAIQTSYRRLLLEEDVFSGFELWRDGRLEMETGIELEVRWDPNQRKLELQGIKGSRAPQAYPDNIAVWEIDRAYDGAVFNSQLQQVRPFRESELELFMQIPEAHAGSKIAVRAIDQVGDHGMKILK